MATREPVYYWYQNLLRENAAIVTTNGLSVLHAHSTAQRFLEAGYYRFWFDDQMVAHNMNMEMRRNHQGVIPWRDVLYDGSKSFWFTDEETLIAFKLLCD